MLDALVNGNAITPTGNANVGELNDSTVNSLFTKATTPSYTVAQQSAIFGQIDRASMAQAVILPEVYAKVLLYRPPTLTNVYAYSPWGMYNYAVLGVSSS